MIQKREKKWKSKYIFGGRSDGIFWQIGSGLLREVKMCPWFLAQEITGIEFPFIKKGRQVDGQCLENTNYE